MQFVLRVCAAAELETGVVHKKKRFCKIKRKVANIALFLQSLMVVEHNFSIIIGRNLEHWSKA